MTIYTLDEREVKTHTMGQEGSSGSSRYYNISMSSWSPRGLAAILQPLSHEGSLDGGLRQAHRVVCTWAEEGVLTPGLVYVVKAFHPEVVRTWQRVFRSNTARDLCIRVMRVK